MLKKFLTVGLSLLMIITLTACSDTNDGDSSGDGNSNTNDTVEERPFTESNGMVKYFMIEDQNICFPETVGEYVKYLELIGTKVELGDTGGSIDDAEKLNAGGVSSMVAYLRVYIDGADDEWQWFGIRYKNDTNKDLPISECKVTQITLDNDTITNEENHHCLDSIVLVTNDDQEIAMDGKTTSHDELVDVIGNPYQNTDGHWHYLDDQGYEYEFVTENRKGVLTRVVITYPEN